MNDVVHRGPPLQQRPAQHLTINFTRQKCVLRLAGGRRRGEQGIDRIAIVTSDSIEGPDRHRRAPQRLHGSSLFSLPVRPQPTGKLVTRRHELSRVDLEQVVTRRDTHPSILASLRQQPFPD